MLLCVEWAIDSAYSVTVLGLLCWPHLSAKYKALCGVSDCSSVCPVGHILGVTHQWAVPMWPAFLLALLSDSLYTCCLCCKLAFCSVFTGVSLFLS